MYKSSLMDPKAAQVAGACGAIIAAIALLFLLLTKKCSERESWDQPRRKVKVIFVSSFLVLQRAWHRTRWVQHCSSTRGRTPRGASLARLWC